MGKSPSARRRAIGSRTFPFSPWRWAVKLRCRIWLWRMFPLRLTGCWARTSPFPSKSPAICRAKSKPPSRSWTSTARAAGQNRNHHPAQRRGGGVHSLVAARGGRSHGDRQIARWNRTKPSRKTTSGPFIFRSAWKSSRCWWWIRCRGGNTGICATPWPAIRAWTCSCLLLRPGSRPGRRRQLHPGFSRQQGGAGALRRGVSGRRRHRPGRIDRHTTPECSRAWSNSKAAAWFLCPGRRGREVDFSQQPAQGFVSRRIGRLQTAAASDCRTNRN